MLARLTSNEIWAKALRIVLMFALVFWVSFRVECLAFALSTDTLNQHENQEPTKLQVYQIDTNKDGEAVVGVMRADSSKGLDEAVDCDISTVDDKLRLGAVRWSKRSLLRLPSARKQMSRKRCPIMSSGRSSLPRRAARAAPMSIADFERDSEGKIKNADQGVVTLVGKKSGTVLVTCTLQGTNGPLYTAQFRVTVKEPYINALEIHKQPVPTGEKCAEELKLSDDECKSYAFWARAYVHDEVNNRDWQYDSTPEHGLSEASGGMFADAQWSVLDSDGKEIKDAAVASIDPKTGQFTLAGDGPVVVRCTVAQSLSGNSYSADVTVKRDKQEPDKPKDIQGDSNPQPSLTVVVDDPYATSDQGNEGDNGQGQEGDGGQAEPTGDTPSEDGINPQAEGDDEQNGQDGQNDQGGEQGNNGANSGDSQNPSGDAEAAKPKETVFKANSDGTISPEGGEPLGLLTGTYTMSSADGATTTTVEGCGTSIDYILDKAGVGLEDQKRVESVDFIMPDHEPVSLSWSEIVDISATTGNDKIMVASLSYVHELNGVKAEDASGSSSGESGDKAGEDKKVSTQADGDARRKVARATSDHRGINLGERLVDGDEGSSGSSAPVQLRDNTRFRILYQGSSRIDPLDLRYINKIVVHMGKPEEKQEDITDPELSIHIDYVPVPYGNEAFLSAVPNNKVGASRFGYTWEISTDGGKTWTTHSDDSVQTLRVMTTDPPDGHIGHMYRVILETDLKNPDGSARGATSEAVTIKASDEFSVVLDYIPPIAGGVANFTSHLYNTNGIDTSKLTYTWEANTGNGWEVIPGAPNAPSWSTPTTPIDSSANSSGEGGGAAVMTYIRVRVTSSEGKTAISNEQPLTVRVGEDSGAPKAQEIGNVLNNNSNDDQSKQKSKKKRKVKEVESVVMEDTPTQRMSDYIEGADGNETVDPTVVFSCHYRTMEYNSARMTKILTYDTTLRDGEQAQGVTLSLEDKLRIARRLDEFGIDIIEGGFPASNPKDIAFFRELREHPLEACPSGCVRLDVPQGRCRSRRCRAGRPGRQRRARGRHRGQDVGRAGNARAADDARREPAHDFRLGGAPEIRRAGGRVRRRAFLRRLQGQSRLRALVRARSIPSGRRFHRLVRDERRGAPLPGREDRRAVVATLSPRIVLPSTRIGIHCHNDSGCAVANTLAAVRAGATQVQGTVNGYGERVGNADLLTVIADLELKMGYTCVGPENLRQMTSVAAYVAEICNFSVWAHAPYVGSSAFAHKGGLHASAMARFPGAYEHIDPSLVGNDAHMLVSELAGKASLVAKAALLGFDLSELPIAMQPILDDVKAREAQGYSYEVADGSLALLIARKLESYEPHFTLESFRVIVDDREDTGALAKDAQSEATIKVHVGDERYVATGEGVGPVGALSKALKMALSTRIRR